MNEAELLEKWAEHFSENPQEMQRLCDLIYQLMTEELRIQQERSGY